jgi:hypothetical protein
MRWLPNLKKNLPQRCQNKWDIFSNVCGLIRKPELYWNRVNLSVKNVPKNNVGIRRWHLKFRYSEEGTNLKKSSTYSVASNVKWKITFNFVAFSVYLNFKNNQQNWGGISTVPTCSAGPGISLIWEFVNSKYFGLVRCYEGKMWLPLRQ